MDFAVGEDQQHRQHHAGHDVQRKVRAQIDARPARQAGEHDEDGACTAQGRPRQAAEGQREHDRGMRAGQRSAPAMTQVVRTQAGHEGPRELQRSGQRMRRHARQRSQPPQHDEIEPLRRLPRHGPCDACGGQPRRGRRHVQRQIQEARLRCEARSHPAEQQQVQAVHARLRVRRRGRKARWLCMRAGYGACVTAV